MNGVYCGYLEPYDNLSVHSAVLTASALMLSKKGTVPVRMINTTDSPVTIHRRKLIGFMKPVQQKNAQVNRITAQNIDSSVPPVLMKISQLCGPGRTCTKSSRSRVLISILMTRIG